LKRSELSNTIYSRDETGIRKFIHFAKYNVDMHIDPDQVLTKTFSAGQLLFSEGEQPQFACFLIKGSGHSYLINDNGETFITNKHLPGSFIGYMAILEQTAHQDNAAVIEDSNILLIPRDIFVQLLSYDNMVAKQFIWLLAGNDLDRQERIRSLSYEALRRRVAESILRIKSSKEPISASAVQVFLSGKKSVGNENIMRVLSDFRSERIIDLNQGEITILQERKLAGVT